MRLTFAFSFLLCAGMTGCDGSDNAPNTDLTVAGDLAGADLTGQKAPDLSGQAGGDLSMMSTNDLAILMSPDLGGAGSSCVTACDCNPGLACPNGKCGVGQVPVYCCGSMTCPNGSLCQFPSGAVDRCGGTDGGIVKLPDLGGIDLMNMVQCNLINCTNGGVAACLQIGCTKCVAGAMGKSYCAP